LAWTFQEEFSIDMWGTKENLHAEFYKEIHEDTRHNFTPQQKAMHLLTVLQGRPPTFYTASLQKQRKKRLLRLSSSS
jgi:hypothetical protein